MALINPHINFNGNAEEAFNFYKSVFGGEFAFIGRFKDMPEGGGKPVPPEDAEKVMHVSLPISKETVLMASDTGGEWASSFSKGNNFSISITTDSKENADKLFAGLSAEGQVTMAMNKTFWGDYFGMFTDKFGINWMVSFNKGQNQ